MTSVVPVVSLRPIIPDTVQGPETEPDEGDTDIPPTWNKSILGITESSTDLLLPFSEASTTVSL